MDRELLLKRQAEIESAIAQSLANHHMLMGRLEETKYNIEQLDMQELVDAGEPEQVKKGK